MRRRPIAIGLASLSGLAYLGAHPPVAQRLASYAVVPLLLAALTVVGDTRRRWSFLLGAVTGAVAFGPLLTWLIAPAGALAWLLLALMQAGFIGIFAVLARPWLESRWGIAVVPILWAGVQAMRGVFPLGGFDWAALAYAQVDGGLFLPLARIAGHRAVEIAIALLGVATYQAGAAVIRSAAAMPSGSWSARIRASVDDGRTSLVTVAGVLAFGALATIEPPAPTGRVLDVLAVQGLDAAADALTGRAEDHAIASNLERLTAESVAADGRPDLTVWPESSLDRDPFTEVGADLLPIAERTARLTGGGLLVGANLTGPRPATFLNASVVFDGQGQPADRYVKRHLVPFGEYVPARSVIGGLPPLRPIQRDGVPGDDEQIIAAGGVPVALAICFETLFAEVVRTNVLASDAGLVVATTNDSSFGVSAESAQHVAQSRMRAVETGRWVVHAALSGSSAIIDPDGRIVVASGQFELSTLRYPVPLVSGSTPFLRIGDRISPFAGFTASILFVMMLLRDRARRVAARWGGGPVDRQGAAS